MALPYVDRFEIQDKKASVFQAGKVKPLLEITKKFVAHDDGTRFGWSFLKGDLHCLKLDDWCRCRDYELVMMVTSEEEQDTLSFSDEYVPDDRISVCIVDEEKYDEAKAWLEKVHEKFGIEIEVVKY